MRMKQIWPICLRIEMMDRTRSETLVLCGACSNFSCLFAMIRYSDIVGMVTRKLGNRYWHRGQELLHTIRLRGRSRRRVERSRFLIFRVHFRVVWTLSVASMATLIGLNPSLRLSLCLFVVIYRYTVFLSSSISRLFLVSLILMRVSFPSWSLFRIGIVPHPL